MQTSIHSLHSETSAAPKFPFQRTPSRDIRGGSSVQTAPQSGSLAYAPRTIFAGAIETGSQPPSHPHVSQRFGTRLRELRRERNLTQVRMAADFGIDRSFISDVERGKKSLSLPMLEVIALGMEISLSDLLRDI